MYSSRIECVHCDHENLQIFSAKQLSLLLSFWYPGWKSATWLLLINDKTDHWQSSICFEYYQHKLPRTVWLQWLTILVCSSQFSKNISIFFVFVCVLILYTISNKPLKFEPNLTQFKTSLLQIPGFLPFSLQVFMFNMSACFPRDMKYVYFLINYCPSNLITSVFTLFFLFKKRFE